MSRIEWNDGWEEDLKRQVYAELQKTSDEVHRKHSGKPVDQVKAALKQALKRRDATFDDAYLEEWAGQISAGERPIVGPPTS